MSYHSLSKETVNQYWDYPTTKKVKAKVKNSISGFFGKTIEVASFGTMGCHDKEGNFYNFYDLEFINPKSEQ